MARSASRAILTGGLVAGTLDLLDALVFYGFRGARPIRILHSIASGWLGAKAYSGGWPAAALGFVSHFTIAFGAAAVYYLASRAIPLLRKQPVMSGVIYGLLVYQFMNLVVLPAAGVRPSTGFAPFANGIFAHTMLIGLPIALAVRKYGR